MSHAPLATPARLSFAAYLLVVVALLGLIADRAIFATGWVGGAVQLLAVILMLWARLTFGLRSFHAAANPTAGGLVTRGPYRLLRHPIYASILYFLWVAVLSHPTLGHGVLGGLATLGLAVRIGAEEYLLRRQYPGYAAYAARTRRVIPLVF